MPIERAPLSLKTRPFSSRKEKLKASLSSSSRASPKSIDRFDLPTDGEGETADGIPLRPRPRVKLRARACGRRFRSPLLLRSGFTLPSRLSWVGLPLAREARRQLVELKNWFTLLSLRIMERCEVGGVWLSRSFGFFRFFGFFGFFGAKKVCFWCGHCLFSRSPPNSSPFRHSLPLSGLPP